SLGFGELVVGQAQAHVAVSLVLHARGDAVLHPHIHPKEGSKVLRNGDLGNLYFGNKIPVAVPVLHLSSALLDGVTQGQVGGEVAHAVGGAVGMVEGEGTEIVLEPAQAHKSVIGEIPVGEGR